VVLFDLGGRNCWKGGGEGSVLGARLGCAEAPGDSAQGLAERPLAVCFGLWNLSVLAPWASRVYCSCSGSGQIRHARRAVLCWLPEFGCLCKELY
jgi:hypothetical protein